MTRKSWFNSQRIPWPLVFFCGLMILLLSCSARVESKSQFVRNYRQDMRSLVQRISVWSKKMRPGFIVIPQNGLELLTDSQISDAMPVESYLRAIDGIGQESLFYGYPRQDEATPIPETNYLIHYADIVRSKGDIVMVTDYCRTRSLVDDSYAKNRARHYISYAASQRELNIIADYPAVPMNVNDADITLLSEAKNFLYILNSDNYPTKADFLNALGATDYDVIIMDLFFNTGEPFSKDDLLRLKYKSNGAARLVIAYMSIGEAEKYRYYWKPAWRPHFPSWLEAENPDWEGNYKVRYWDSKWQQILFGNEDSYLQKIIDAGFDGVYMDIIDAFEYFEAKHKSKKSN